MSTSSKSLFLLFLLLCTAAEAFASTGVSPAVQAALQAHGFPAGLLPGTVLSYDLQPSDGRFQIWLQDDGCRFTIHGYPISYANAISGTIVDGSIADLDGVSVRVFRRWWPISSIRSIDGGRNVAFDIGTLSVNYPASNFDDIPVCDGTNSSLSSRRQIS